MEVFVAIVEDRHSEAEAQPFRDRGDAIEWAVNQVPDYAFEDNEDMDSELTEDMKRAGWIFNMVYSCEGDSVRVVRTELR